MFFNKSTHWVFKVFITFALQSTTERQLKFEISTLMSMFVSVQLLLFVPSFVYSVRDRKQTVLFFLETCIFTAIVLVLFSSKIFGPQLSYTMLVFCLLHLFVCQWQALHVSGILFNNHTFCYYLCFTSAFALPTFTCLITQHEATDAINLIYSLWCGELIGIITWIVSYLVVGLSNGLEEVMS